MTKLTIHRGAEEIGGSCIEISDDKTRLIFDIGLPLDSIDSGLQKEDYKLNIPELYSPSTTNINAIFITHAHLDHFGLLEFINPEIPVFISQTTYNILTKISPLLNKTNFSGLNLNIIESEVPIKVGAIEIIAHNVDHSVADAMAFEITIGGKKILYTGDLRFHGRKKYLSKNLSAIEAVDYLLMEGSTINRLVQTQKTEDELMLEMSEHFKNDKLSIVTFSAQNIDRFVSVYKACLKAKKTLVIDPYTCFVLESFKNLSKNIPQFDWNNITVYFSKNSITDKLAESKDLFRYKKKKITLQEIVDSPEKYVIKDNFKITTALMKLFNVNEVQLIYSMWSGYLENPSHLDSLKSAIVCCHTSGHACIKDLQEFVKKIKPKNIIPIHTDAARKFPDLFAANVIILQNQQTIVL